MARRTVELKVDEKYRWIKDDPSGYLLWEDITITEMYIIPDVLTGRDMLSLTYRDSFWKSDHTLIDGSKFSILESEKNADNVTYKRILLEPGSDFPDIDLLDNARACTHDWANTGEMLWSFCKKCNVTGDWSRSKSKYEVKK